MEMLTKESKSLVLEMQSAQMRIQSRAGHV